MGGERAKNIGEEAEDKVVGFIRLLGYTIDDVNNEEYDLDCIATSPPETPKVGLARPRYSPSGQVAFEIKEPAASIPKVKAFKKKIQKYNRSNNEKLSGGIYIADSRISVPMLNTMRNLRIWGWCVRRQRLYREKVNAFHYWFKSQEAFTTEMPLDEQTSFLRISTLPPRASNELLNFSVFIDDLAHPLSPRTVKLLMNKIKTASISPLIELGMRPMTVYFEFHSIGGLSKHVSDEIYRTVVVPWKDEGITVNVKNPFRDYRTFATL